MFSDNIPQDLIDQHTEIHNYLIQIVGGYDGYVHITYELDGNNDSAILILNRLGVFNGHIQSINDIHNVRGCLAGFTAFTGFNNVLWVLDQPEKDYSFCVQPNPLTDPHNSEYRIAEGDSYRYEIMHGWIHEYFHHYQKAHIFERALEDPVERNPVGAPAWWVEGAAGIFPDLFMYEYFDQLSYTQTNNFGFDKYTMLKFSDLSTWVWREEKAKFEDPNFSCLETEASRDTAQCSWTYMNYYLAYYINLKENPNFDKIPNTGLQVVWVKLLEDMHSLNFEGSFLKHVGISLNEFYQKYDDFIRNAGDTPPENFFPTALLSELVDFLSIDSSLQ